MSIILRNPGENLDQVTLLFQCATGIPHDKAKAKIESINDSQPLFFNISSGNESESEILSKLIHAGANVELLSYPALPDMMFTFKTWPFSRNVFRILKGGTVELYLKQNCINIHEKCGIIDDEYDIPYYDIKKYEFRNSKNIAFVIETVIYIILGIIALFLFAPVGIVMLVVTAIVGFPRCEQTVLEIEKNDGSFERIAMQRVKNQAIQNRNQFLKELQVRLEPSACKTTLNQTNAQQTEPNAFTTESDSFNEPMILCPKCQSKNKSHASFCSSCGCQLNNHAEPQKKFCIHCGNELEGNASFCYKCGNSVE